jgi:hypothetical protein
LPNNKPVAPHLVVRLGQPVAPVPRAVRPRVQRLAGFQSALSRLWPLPLLLSPPRRMTTRIPEEPLPHLPPTDLKLLLEMAPYTGAISFALIDR